MNKRLPLIVSSIALVLALLGSTPLGQAAESALEQVVPRAKRADFAANAGKLNGHKSAVNPKRGQIPVVGAGRQARRLARSGRRQGRSRPAGAAGRPGRRRLPARQRGDHRAGRQRGSGLRRQLPGRQVRPVGGGYTFRKEHVDALFVFESQPVNNSTWRFKVSNETGGPKPMTLFALCANVAS